MIIEKDKGGQDINGQKLNEGYIGNQEKVSSEVIKPYLNGMRYPAYKSTLINKAKENNAPLYVMNVINQFQEKQYSGSVEVKKEIERIG
jgi:hypothetical protein